VQSHDHIIKIQHETACYSNNTKHKSFRILYYLGITLVSIHFTARSKSFYKWLIITITTSGIKNMGLYYDLYGRVIKKNQLKTFILKGLTLYIW
jgi:hypothetical protein